MKEYVDKGSKEKYIEGIDEEFQDLAVKLSKMDFSKGSNKNSIFETTLKNINYKENKDMNKIKKAGAIVASLVIVSVLAAQTSFAQDAVNSIIKKISLGHFTAIQTDNYNDDNSTKTLSDNLKGKLFDKNGNTIENISKDIIKDGIYTEDGEKVASVENDGKIITEKQIDEEFKKHFIVVTDKSKINDYMCFEVKLPNYLPDGYEFEEADFYKDGEVNVKEGKSASLHFINQKTGEKIVIQESLACEEAKSTLESRYKIENIKINDAEAVLVGDNSIHWEANNTIYFLIAKDINRDEVIKIAESIK